MDSTLDCYESEVAAVADLPRSTAELIFIRQRHAAPPAFQIESMQLALAAIALSVDAACGRFGGKSARQRAMHGAAAAPHCTPFSLSSPAAHTQPHTRSPIDFLLDAAHTQFICACRCRAIALLSLQVNLGPTEIAAL